VKTDDDAKQLDELIRAAIGRGPPAFDFQRWKREHPRQIEAFRTETRPGAGTVLAERRRTIRRGLKIAAAAAIVLAGLIVASQFIPSLDGATAAYAKVTQAMRDVPWMRIRYRGYILDEEENRASTEGALDTEIWYSFNAQVVILKYSGGQIIYNDYARQEVYTYNPHSKRIILSALSSGWLSFRSDSPWDWLERNAQRTMPHGGEATRRTGQYQGQDVEIFDIASAVEPGIAATRDRVFVDRTTFLPIAEERTYINTKIGKPQRVETGTFDYPPQGPADIYGLGLSRDIPTINSLPLPDWDEIGAAYRSHHEEAAPERYIAVVTRELALPGNPVESVDICYTDGARSRQERHFLFVPGPVAEQWQPQAAELGTTADSILNWSRAYLAHGEISIDLYDSSHCYSSRRDENGSWSLTQQTFGDRGLTKYDLWNTCPAARLGWPEIGYEADIIQDDYARENHLIRVEASGGTFWLNPERDYICQRRSTINGQEDVTEFSQTNDGRWYPKRVESRGLNHTIWIETHVEFPEGIFDPNRLPKTNP
jgi:hypothetical protein